MPLTALDRIRQSFPKVEKVIDATDSIDITVLPEDSVKGRKKDPQACALARACMREKGADGAIIGIAYSYLIRGTVATRYSTSVAVAREITTFDRHQDFAPGDNYKLSKVSPSNRRENTPAKAHAAYVARKAKLAHYYKLSKVNKGSRLDDRTKFKNSGHSGDKGSSGPIGEKRTIHRTADVRIIKGVFV